MGYAAHQAAMTAEEFLAWEAVQTERHDFVDGEVFAMAGAEARHITVTGNVYMALRQHLSGTPCRTFMADMKVAAAAQGSNFFFYPDVVVTCSPADRQSQLLVTREPSLIVEVLSPWATLNKSARVGAPGFGMGCEAQSAAIPDGIASICNEADRPKPGYADREGLVQRCPNTAAYDLGSKFAQYRQIPTLREIAFIDLDARRTDVYHKGADGLWVLHPFDAGADVPLASVDLTITAAALFADVDEAPPASGTLA